MMNSTHIEPSHRNTDVEEYQAEKAHDERKETNLYHGLMHEGGKRNGDIPSSVTFAGSAVH